MDLDLAQVRAFVATADCLHFGRAAELLGITQQALSKRVARLEVHLAVRLFDRGRGHGIRLTDAGDRFLVPAQQLLAAGERAVSAASGGHRRLRIDVWGHLFAPMRTLADVLTAEPGVAVEPGTGRDFPSVVASLRRGETDVGFGRVPGGHDVEHPDLAHRMVRLEPVDAVVSAAHPRADAAQLRPSDLRDDRLRCPADAGRLDFLTSFADRFDIRHLADGPNLGLEPFLRLVARDPGCFSLFPADAVPAGNHGVRFIPLVSPTPLYAWSLLWLRSAGHPSLPVLEAAFAGVASRRRWLDFDPRRDWLPGTDRQGAATRTGRRAKALER
ncbi:LysR family transcriptional regulator [Streptomyces sp. NPDC059169]|uniref:LysR family transcriptional regulator n=1 Tax=Streptomyces sp. NPDC059169 TaxID=3346754 RepID=UPI0036CA4779